MSKYGTSGDEIPSENNGEHDKAASPVMEDYKGIFDGEQHGDTSEAVDDLNLDHQDATCPSSGSAPVNGESSEDIQNDVDPPHDGSESVTAGELESNIGAQSLSHDDEPEFTASDYVESKEDDEPEFTTTDDVEGKEANDDTAAEDVDTEERASGEHSDPQDAEPCEPSSEVVGGAADTDVVDAAPDADVIDAPPDSDVVDALSPMDVDAEQPADAEITASDAGCDGAMEVEYPTGTEDATCTEDATGTEDADGSTSCQLATDSSNKYDDQPSPMAEDTEDVSKQSDHAPAEEVNDLQDSENVVSQASVSDAAEYDEVDALQSKPSHQSEVADNSEDLDESGSADGLVEGADFTVELQPDTSEQDSAASEAEQPVSETEATEKTCTELETRTTEESDKQSDDVKTTVSDDSTAARPIASDVVRISSRGIV